MKRATFFITLLIAGIIFNASSQDNRMWLGGTLSLSGQSNGQTHTTSVFMPEFGYSTGNSWSFGTRAGRTCDRTVLQGDTRRYTTISVIPFARYTFGEIAGFRIFGQGELPVQFYGGRHFDGTSMDRSNSIGLMARPGIEYHLGERWGFNMLMPPVLNFVNYSNGTTSFHFGINNGYTIQEYLLSTSIGFIYRF